MLSINKTKNTSLALYYRVFTIFTGGGPGGGLLTFLVIRVGAYSNKYSTFYNNNNNNNNNNNDQIEHKIRYSAILTFDSNIVTSTGILTFFFLLVGVGEGECSLFNKSLNRLSELLL